MSKKQIVLFTPLTPNGELPLNRIIRITHTTLLKHNLVRDGGENMAQLHVRLGSGWVPAATEHEHIHAKRIIGEFDDYQAIDFNS